MNNTARMLALALVCFTLPVHTSIAESITIPVTGQGLELRDIERPRKGSSQQQVIKKFGKPVSVSGPVGNPPIARWEYSNFNVYFEYDHVIHSVLKHTTAAK